MRRLGTTVEGTAVTYRVGPMFYKSTCEGGNIRLLLSTIISCLPTPASVPTVGNMLSGNRRSRERSSSRRPFSTLTFGVVASPFINGLTFFEICSKVVRKKSCILGSAGNGEREVNHVLRVRTGAERRVARMCTKSVTTTMKLGSAAAKSALYSPTRPVVLRSVRFPRPIVSITVRPGSGTTRRGVNVTLRGLTRRSPAFEIGASRRAKRAVVSNVNRLRLRVVISELLERFGIRTGINTPRITCERAVARPMSIRCGCSGRSNNENRCKRIGVEIVPRSPKANCGFRGGAINKSMPGRCIKPASTNVRNTVTSNVITKCPIISITIRLCSNSCRRISSSRVTFGVTNSVTVGSTLGGNGSMLLRPFFGIRIIAPRRCVKSIVNKLGSGENLVRNVRTESNTRIVGTFIPLSRVFKCSARLESAARNHTACAVVFSRCRRIPTSITGGVTRKEWWAICCWWGWCGLG